MSNLMPVKLKPTFKDYLWGGTRLKEEFGKECDLERVAESWELSAHKDGQSIVEGGAYANMTLSEYIDTIGRDALGENSLKYDYFPLLIKLIDAKGDLSVQVHPSDSFALANEGEYGKTEMWYVLAADEGACLYYGFQRDVSKEEYKSAIAEGRLTDLLCRVPVKPGDVFFIPAGTVHAIGAGILICEIQQNSNTTYRVYDYNRRDKDGNLRPLHIEKALQVSDLKKSPSLPVIGDEAEVTLADCEYFKVRRLRVSDRSEICVDRSSFLSLTVTRGEGVLRHAEGEAEIKKGDTLFIPAQEACFEVVGDLEMIESKVN